MMRPRRKILAIGFVLMVISRVCGLVLPVSSKYLIDNVIGKNQLRLLAPTGAGGLGRDRHPGRHFVYAITQLLSKAGQRLIAELRAKVQAHIGRLPVAYYDANKTGTLVARIMTDVDGIRNLLGTGLMEFVGGMLTALLVLGYLLRISPLLTGIALRDHHRLRAGPAQGLRHHPADFPRARQDQRRGHGTAHRIAGRRARGEGLSRRSARRSRCSQGGVQRLLNNVLKSLTAISFMSLSATVLMGVVGAVIMYVGARQITAQAMTLGDFMTFTALLAFLIAPMFQVVSIGTQLTEALAGSGPHAGSVARAARRRGPAPHGFAATDYRPSDLRST